MHCQRDAAIARQILAADLVLLADLDDQIRAAETALESLLPHSPYATLTSVPGWGWCHPITLPPWVIRAGGRAAADLSRVRAVPDAV